MFPKAKVKAGILCGPGNDGEHEKNTKSIGVLEEYSLKYF